MTGNQNLGENWYIVLDLYPDKREEGLEVNLNRKIIEEIIQKQIMERLNQKALEWSKSTDNNTKKYLSLKNKIEEDMRNSQKRKEFSKDLKKRLKDIDEAIGHISNNISENEIKQFSNVLGIGTEILTEHIKRKGIEIKKNWNTSIYSVNTSTYNSKDYLNFLENIKEVKIEEDNNIKEIEKNLKILEKNDLYEFLKSEGLSKYFTEEVLKQKMRKISGSSSKSNARTSLFILCKKVLLDSEKRKRYKEYLERKNKHLKYKEIEKQLSFFKTIIASNEGNNKKIGEITREYLGKIEEVFINDKRNRNEIKKETENIIIGFCKDKKNGISNNISDYISYYISNKEHEKQNTYEYARKPSTNNYNFANTKKSKNESEPEYEKRENTEQQVEKNFTLIIITFFIFLIFILFLIGMNQKTSSSDIVQDKPVSNEQPSEPPKEDPAPAPPHEENPTPNDPPQNNENNQQDIQENQDNEVLLNPDYRFVVSDSTIYYGEEGNDYVETILKNNTQNLVIKRLSRERYNNLLTTGVAGRTFIFRCGAKVKKINNTIYVDSGDDVVGFQDIGSLDTIEDIQRNNGCFTDINNVLSDE